MKHLKWILLIALLIVGYYLYIRGILGFLGLKHDPYQELRANIGPYGSGDGLWGAVERAFQPVDEEEHQKLFHTADAFLKGYDLAADGWTFQMSLADEFEAFLDLNGYMLSSQVRIGEYVY